MTGLSFGNGVALSPNEDFLLVGETCGKSVWKYHIEGAQKGNSEVIVKMPGLTTNVQKVLFYNHFYLFFRVCRQYKAQ